MTQLSMQPNLFKQAIAARESQVGLWCTMCSPIAAEIVSEANYDWLLFDSEHSPVEVSGLLPLLQAAERGTSHSVIRVAWNDRVLLKRVLDIGAQTVLVPFVENSEEARQAVSAARYPLKGSRGVAGVTRATRYGRCKEYIHKANDQLCMIVQIETPEAVGNIEEIAAVDGVDGIFVGPSDLSASMGYPGNPSHEVVQTALLDAVRRINESGKPAGILATNVADAKRYLEWGYTFVAVGLDVGLFVQAVDTLREQF